MNWYKRAQQLEIDESPKDGYISVGHNIYRGLDTDYEGYKSNYMWQWVDGQVEVEEETNDQTGHASIPRWMSGPATTYSGRYDGGTGIISIIKPYHGPLHFRDIPKTVQYQLRKAFPEATKIAVY